MRWSVALNSQADDVTYTDWKAQAAKSLGVRRSLSTCTSSSAVTGPHFA